MNYDRTNSRCHINNCNGIYREKSLHDDMDGTLHCNICDNCIKRYDVGQEQAEFALITAIHQAIKSIGDEGTKRIIKSELKRTE